MSIDVTLQRKLLVLGRNGRWSEGIPLLKRALRDSPPEDKQELSVNLAAFLYHNAFHRNALDIENDKDTKLAISICRKIISNHQVPHDKSLINARIFLAQILAAAYKNEAKKIARETFRIYGNALAANRLANVYEWLGNNKLAERYYIRYKELAKRDGPDLPYVYLDLASFYRNIGNHPKSLRYLRKARNSARSKSDLSLRKLLESFK